MAKQNRVKDSLSVAVGRVAVLSRNRKYAPHALESARADLVAARLERAINEAFNPAPPYRPIRARDRDRLAKMLKEGPREGTRMS